MNVIMRKDIYYDNMDIVLLPDDIFSIEGYSSENIDNTSLIDGYIRRQVMSNIPNDTAIELFINYGFTRALVSTLNIIFEKIWTVESIYITMIYMTIWNLEDLKNIKKSTVVQIQITHLQRVSS